MKFVDLKCPNCGGRLMPVEGNTKIVACEYCKSQYILEDDRVINYHVHQHIESSGSGNSRKDFSGAVSAVWATLIFAGAGFLFLIGAGIISRDILAPAQSYRYLSASVPAAEEEEEYTSACSPFYEELIEGIYGKTADMVTAEELQRLRYLSIRNTRDTFFVDFSFGDPYGEGLAAVQSAGLEPKDWDTDDLANFPNLEKLELSYRWADGAVLGKLKKLKGLSCHGGSPAELAQWLEPEQLVELRMDGPESLEGLSGFENLEILALEDVMAPDLRQLAALGKLRSLKIVEKVDSGDSFSQEETHSMTDYSALSVLTGLEKLDLKSEAIREVSFLKPLTSLTELSLKETEAISMEPLADFPQLTFLSLEDNSSLKDYEFLSALSGLQSLKLDKSTSQPDPDLSALSRLEELDVSGLISVAPLGRLTNLKTLSIHGCNIDEIRSISSLTKLSRLACYSVWTYSTPLKDVRFLDGMTGLKYLDLCGASDGSGWSGYGRKTEIYGDISHALNHAGLEELYLNDSMFEIDFGQLQENPSLRKLQLKNVSLKKNFHVESNLGMTDIWYDDVTMDEHTGFLKLYPNLEELDLDGNQLTNIQFASDLKKLTRLSLNNNYVTDLAPLNQVEGLKYLDIRQNPVSSMPEADGEIEIVR